MMRLASALLAFATLAAAPSPAAAGAPAARSQLRGFACSRVLDPAQRSITVRVVMRPRPGTRRLALRFDLLVRRPVSSESAIHKGDLGTWISPSNRTLGQLPGDVWKFEKSVVELGAPASYRLRVSFRWIGTGGRVIGAAVRYTPRCRQRELRPDLLVQAPITVTPVPGHPDRAVYSATIANAGATGSGPFDVLFSPGDGSNSTRHSVSRLGPHQTRTESFLGPLCSAASSGSPPTITADSAGQVDDLNRANNALSAACPSPGWP